MKNKNSKQKKIYIINFLGDINTNIENAHKPLGSKLFPMKKQFNSKEAAIEFYNECFYPTMEISDIVALYNQSEIKTNLKKLQTI